MAASYQHHPNKQQLLKQFILKGEAELDNLAEPERTIRAQSLLVEFQRRFKHPEDTIEIGGYTQAPTKEDVDDAQQEADEGSGEGRFVSHLRVKCMDNGPLFNQVLFRGPDLQVIGNIAAKPDDVQLVSEGEIRVEERGYHLEPNLDYKPKRPYHDRVASWMFKLQCDRAAKQTLKCHFCGASFDGRKGQKYCSDDCRKHRSSPRVEEVNEYGEFGCDEALTLFFQLRLEYLMQKFDVEELTSGMTLDVAEKQRLTDLAVYMVKESSNEQQ